MIIFLCLQRFPWLALSQQHLQMKHFVPIVYVFVCSLATLMRSLFKVAPDQSSCTRRAAISSWAAPGPQNPATPTTPPSTPAARLFLRFCAGLLEHLWTFLKTAVFAQLQQTARRMSGQTEINIMQHHAMKHRFMTLPVMIYSGLTFDSSEQLPQVVTTISPDEIAEFCGHFDKRWLHKTLNSEDKKRNSTSVIDIIYKQKFNDKTSIVIKAHFITKCWQLHKR